MTNKRKLLATLTIAGTIGFTALAPSTLVRADFSTESEFNDRLDELSGEQAEAEQRLEVLEAEIAETEAAADELLSEMELTNERLEELQAEIENLHKVIHGREEQLYSQARAVQVSGETRSIIKFLLEAESLSDVIARLDVITTLVSANQDLIQQQVADRESLESKEMETIATQEEQQRLGSELESKKVELEERSFEQESLVASIAAEFAEVAEDRDAFLEVARQAEERRQELAAAQEASRQVTVLSESSSSDSSSSDSSSSEQASTSSTESESTSAAESTPAPAQSGGSIVNIAHSLTGSRYVYGGTSPSGFDCSGFVTYVYQQAGARSLPRTAAGMYNGTTRISRSEAQPGDLVFFRQGSGIDHVGIYLGNSQFIGAQTPGVGVASLNSPYWSQYIAGFGR